MQCHTFSISVVVEQQLDPATVSWVEDLNVSYGENLTILSGILADQTAIFGLINRLRDLGLHIIKLQVERDNNTEMQH